MHLAENQVEKLPEGGVFGHALVAVDVVVAAAEGDLEHLVVGDTGMGVGNDLLGADRLFRHRPVANGVALGFKALLLFLDEKEFQAVGPQAVLNRFDLAHDGFNLVEIFCGLFKITDASGILTDIRFLAAEHGAAKVFNGVILAMVEDGDIHFFAPTDGEIQLHILWRESVFMDQGANNPLTHQLFLRFLDLFAGNVVERVSRRDGILGLLVLLFAHIKTPFTEAEVISGRPRRNLGLCVSVALSMRRCPFGKIATGLGP